MHAIQHPITQETAGGAPQDVPPNPNISKVSLLRARSPASPLAPSREVPRDPAPSAAGAEAATSPSDKPGHAAAFGLLEDVKRFIPLLLKENEELRAGLERREERSRQEIEALQDQTREWQSVADELTAEVTTLEAAVLDLKRQLRAAEAEVARERELASKAGQEAAEAECLSKLFEDTVISSFGIGTMFQEAVERIGAAKA